MPAAQASLDASPSLADLPRALPFPPVTKSHILNCSYHSWHPRYRSQTPKARLIPLPPTFLSYLRADGIILPSDDTPVPTPSHSPLTTPPTSVENSSDEDDDSSDPEPSDPSLAWPETHTLIKATIKELGGAVMPKLNWSAPKDATWISATNSMDCRDANEIYLLLKSSDFVVHDLEQVFEGTIDSTFFSQSWSKVPAADGSGGEEEDEEEEEAPKETASKLPSASQPLKTKSPLDQIPYHLILRKTIPALNPALEFRCFVRSRRLLCLCQRDLNHYDFLPPLVPKLRALIQGFFDRNLKYDFPDENFAFDVYVPPPHERCWLIDVNPWAERTDPLLFSWVEVLGMVGDEGDEDEVGDDDGEEEEDIEEEGDEAGEEELIFTPEFRLVNRDDPEAYRFNTPQYSAHKLPKDVVDASVEGEAGLREFMGRWREVVRREEERGGGGGEEED